MTFLTKTGLTSRPETSSKYPALGNNQPKNMSVFADMTTSSEVLSAGDVDNLGVQLAQHGVALRQGDEAGRGAGAAVAQFPPNHERFMLRCDVTFLWKSK